MFDELNSPLSADVIQIALAINTIKGDRGYIILLPTLFFWRERQNVRINRNRKCALMKNRDEK